MAEEGGVKMAEVKSNQVKVTKQKVGWVISLLRLLAFSALAAATLVMGLNKQTKTLVVPIGNTPISVTLTAKFQHTPAFVFFVVANGIASLHNLFMLATEFVAYKYDKKGLLFKIMAILDMMTVGLVAGGASAAAFMGELGRNGNSHARWNKICDKFATFCNHGAGAMIASYIGLLLLITINVISIIKLQNRNSSRAY